MLLIAFSIARRATDSIAEAELHHARDGFRRSLFDRPELHEAQEARRFVSSYGWPPNARGMTWSTWVATPEHPSIPTRQRWPSRSSTMRRTLRHVEL